MSSRIAEIPPFREGTFRSQLHDERTAAILGIAVGVAFVICMITGVISHLVQEPPSWFTWPSRPAGWYRLNQGLHVTTGLALIPLDLAKLWVVFPKLFEWPPLQSATHAVERLAMLPLIGGTLLLLFTGLGNINIFRPWDFSFRRGHFAAAWIALGALVLHVAAKWATTRLALRREADGDTDEPADTAGPTGGLQRRGFIATAFGASALVALTTVGQTFEPLARIAVLAPRRPDVGPQGFPVNRTAASVQLEDVDIDAYRLTIDGAGVAAPVTLTYDDLRARPQHEAELAIACVEGWSASRRWRGVRVRDLLELAGVDEGATSRVHAMHESSRQKTSDLNAEHSWDRDTLLALEVEGEVLHPDHGFPLRLIGPNRPGVMQTKWVERLEVLT